MPSLWERISGSVRRQEPTVTANTRPMVTLEPLQTVELINNQIRESLAELTERQRTSEQRLEELRRPLSYEYNMPPVEMPAFDPRVMPRVNHMEQLLSQLQQIEEQEPKQNMSSSDSEIWKYHKRSDK